MFVIIQSDYWWDRYRRICHNRRKHDTVPIGVMVKKALFLKKFREQLLYILTKSYSDNFGDISVLISCSL